MTRVPPITALIWVAAALVIAVEVAVAVLALYSAQRDERSDATATLERFARSSEADINQRLLGIDSMLLGLGNLLSLTGEGEDAGAETFGDLLSELRNQNPLLQDVLLFGRDGRLINAASRSSRDHPPSVAGSAESVFARGIAAGLWVDKVQRNPRNGEWTVSFARIVRLTDTRLVLAVAEVSANSIAEGFMRAGPTEGLRAQLETESGMLLAVYPHDDLRLGRVDANPVNRDAADGLAREAVDSVSGEPAVVLAQPLSNRALIIRLAYMQDAILEDWYAEARLAAGLSLLFFLVTVASAFLLVRALRLRQSAQSKAQTLQKTLRSAIESMTEGFTLFDHEMRLVTFNARYLEIFPHIAPVAKPGVSAEELFEAASKAILPDANEAERRRWIDWRRRMQFDENGQFEQRFPDGRVIETSLWRTADGGNASVHRDVTLQRERDRQLCQAKDEAELANNAKSAFLANMSHELRTPLNAIIGFSEVIQRLTAGGDSNGRCHEYAGDILESGQHLLALINDILDLSKVEAGQLQPVLEAVDPLEIARTCRGMAMAVAYEKPLSWREDFDVDGKVLIDGRLFQQIVTNLLSNAVKFTAPGGSVVFAVKTVAAVNPQARQCLRVVVSDDGCGIPEDRLRHVVEPFQQADPRTSRTYGGSGLGLSIVNSLVTMLGGQMTIESVVGEGTTVSVTLPAESAERQEELQASDRPRRRA